MCVAQTAKRRRRQSMNGYRHMAPLRRPHYLKMDEGKAQRREHRKVEKIKLMQTRKKK